MTIYVCYYDYDDWDMNSPPIIWFKTEEEARDWCDNFGQLHAVYREMVIGQEYVER